MPSRRRKGGGQAARARQQQEAAAKRRGPRPAEARDQPAETAAAAPWPAAAAPGEDAGGRPRHYLDVSAVRIQEWLARTPDLKLRRGASVLLTEATAREETEHRLPPGMRWNDEAGQVNGVVSLVLGEAVPDPEACLAEAARHVARRMRAAMPHIHIQAVAGSGATYAGAYEQMAQARRAGRLLADLPPAAPEIVVAKPCDQCRSAAAVHPQVAIIAGEKREDLCDECHKRFQAAGGTQGDDLRRSPLPERRMKQALEDAGMAVNGFSDNFATMAAAGETRGDDAATQLALIYADGNRVGAFLHKAAAYGGHGLDKGRIVRVIDDAAIGALADAVLDRFPGWLHPPVLAHIAGGDDLLISVPAADGWLFTVRLLASFGCRVDAASHGWPAQVREARPSLSAGLVFSHLKHPFSDLVRVAGRELDKAKKAEHGKQAAVSFLDLTADGDPAPPDRRPLRLSYLQEHAEELERIEAIPPSRRQALLALIRQGAVDDLIRRVTDFDDNQPLWNVVAGRGATREMARDTLSSETARTELRRLLDIARHWTTRPRPEQITP